MEQIANKFAGYISNQLHYDDEKTAVVKYGFMAFSQMVIILVLAVVFGAFTRTLAECLVICFVVSTLRRYSGGAHASTMAGCIFVSVFTIGGMALLSRYVISPVLTPAVLLAVSIICFLAFFVLMYRYVPVDSPNKPIVKPEKIKRLRRQSFTMLAVSFAVELSLIICLFFKDYAVLYSIAASVLLAFSWQVFTLTLTGRRILGGLDKAVSRK